MGTINESLTFDDVLLVPQYSSVLPSETNITSNLTKNIKIDSFLQIRPLFFMCVSYIFDINFLKERDILKKYDARLYVELFLRASIIL